MGSTAQILLGLIISSAIGALAYRRGSLSRSGWVGAIITGTTIFGFGGWPYGIALVFFFVSSTLLSRWRKHYKATLEAQVFEKGSQRDIWQALANGGVAALACVAMVWAPESTMLLGMWFVGAMATVTADTWATELGVLAKSPPRLITTLQAVPRGTSGAISLAGTVATSLGAIATATVWMLSAVLLDGTALSWGMIAVGAVAGIVGSLSDSLMGATIQRSFMTPTGISERAHAPDGSAYPLHRGWMWVNNDMVNAVSSAVGAAVSVLLWLVINP
jgi:uncharacterized protein (TIGR00297 family)